MKIKYYELEKDSLKYKTLDVILLPSKGVEIDILNRLTIDESIQNIVYRLNQVFPNYSILESIPVDGESNRFIVKMERVIGIGSF